MYTLQIQYQQTTMSSIDTEVVLQLTRDKLGGKRDPYLRILQLLKSDDFVNQPGHDGNKKLALAQLETFYEQYITTKPALLSEYNRLVAKPVTQPVSVVRSTTQLPPAVMAQTGLESEVSALRAEFDKVIATLRNYVATH
jgi:hypothetical protein